MLQRTQNGTAATLITLGDGEFRNSNLTAELVNECLEPYVFITSDLVVEDPDDLDWVAEKLKGMAQALRARKDQENS